MFFIPEPKPNARVRLFCFPYAGGSIKTFISWAQLLPGEIELAILELPGKGRRVFESPFTSIDNLITEIILEMQLLDNKQSIFFGHSLGAKVAFECCLRLSKSKLPLPDHLFLSACGSPNTHLTTSKSHLWNDDDFIDSLETLNGTPKEVLENRELMEILLPGIRADFQIAETYFREVEATLNLQTTILAGTEDSIKDSALENWNAFLSPKPDTIWIEGGHFFVDTSPEIVVNTILSKLRLCTPINSGFVALT
jgi:medium-chain acyl-[acyl-carrier-protein] hydrolase